MYRSARTAHPVGSPAAGGTGVPGKHPAGDRIGAQWASRGRTVRRARLRRSG